MMKTGMDRFTLTNLSLRSTIYFCIIILIYRCQKFRIRTDLQDTGIYICKFWILNFLLLLEKDYDMEISSLNVSYTRL